jgi:sugar transferase (PEP-CTERM/EpsH1 system associated)
MTKPIDGIDRTAGDPIGRPRRAARPRSGLRILYLCHRVPCPPDKGEKIRAFHQIRALARRHKVHLLTLADSPVPDLSPLEEICEQVEVFPLSRPAAYLRTGLRLASPRPLTLSFFESAALADRLRGLARREPFDVQVAYSSAMASYADLLPAVPAVLDMVDVDSAKWAQYARFAPLPMRPLYALEARRLRRYERSLAPRFERIFLATGNEARLYRANAPEARVETVLNGVSPGFFETLDLPKSPHPSLVFTGQMDYFANVDGVIHFTRDILPRLRRRLSELELVIVGRSPAPAVRRLGEFPGVRVTGAVNDVRPFLARAWAMVVPLRIAQGVQNKALEAIAANLPLVCSDRVLAGLSDGGFRSGRDLLAAGTDEAMESAVAAVVGDAGLRERLAASARQRLTAHYRWPPILERFEALVEAAARPPARVALYPAGAFAGEEERPAAAEEEPDLPCRKPPAPAVQA